MAVSLGAIAGGIDPAVAMKPVERALALRLDALPTVIDTVTAIADIGSPCASSPATL